MLMYFLLFYIVLLFVVNSKAYRWNFGLPQIVKTTLSARKTHDIYIGNLDFQLKKDQVNEAVVKHILGCDEFELSVFNESTSKGYGFFRFSTSRQATHALKLLNDLVINNRTAKVSYQASNTVSFNNLDPSITAPVLKKICDDTIGRNSIVDLSLPTHPTSGVALGYALITFATEELAYKALKTLNGIHLLNKVLSLSLAPAAQIASLPRSTEPVTGEVRRQTPSAADQLPSFFPATLKKPYVNFRAPHTVFVHNINKACTETRFEQELHRILGDKVVPEWWRLVVDKVGKFRGYGYVNFRNEADVSIALPLLNAAWILDRYIGAEMTRYEESDKLWQKKTPPVNDGGTPPQRGVDSVVQSDAATHESANSIGDEPVVSDAGVVYIPEVVIGTDADTVEAEVVHDQLIASSDVADAGDTVPGDAVEQSEEVVAAEDTEEEEVVVTKPKRKRAPAKKKKPSKKTKQQQQQQQEEEEEDSNEDSNHDDKEEEGAAATETRIELL